MKLGESLLQKKTTPVFEKIGSNFIFLIISFLLIFADSLGIFKPVYTAANFVVAPAQYYVNNVRTFFSEFFYTFSNVGNFKNEISKLKIEVAELKSQNTTLERYKKEVEDLKKQLNIKGTEDFKLVEASVIGGDPSGLTSIYRINRGERDGIKKGLPVIYQGILIGRIEKTSYSVSSLMLLTNPQSAVPAINGRSAHKGIVRGSLNALVMEDILQKEDIQVGDKIVTLGDLFPRGLLIGTVKNVISSETSPKKTAILEPAIDYTIMQNLYVVVNFDPDEFSPQ